MTFSSAWLQHNVQILQETHPALATRVLQHLQTNPELPMAADLQGRMNIPIQSGGARTWLYPADTDQQCAQLAAQLRAAENPQTLVWIGLGLGYHWLACLHAPHPRTRYHVVIDRNMGAFCAFLALANRESLLRNPDIFWLIDIAPDTLETEFTMLLRHQEMVPSIHLHTVVDLGFQRAYGAEARAAWEEFASNVAEDMQVAPYDQYAGMHFFLRNIEQLSKNPLLQEFRGAFAGKPGIVISPGPSLPHAVDRLRRLQDRAVLFCGDSGLHVAQSHGIYPQFSGCLERKQLSAEQFRKADTSRTILVASPIVHPEVYTAFRGPKIHISRNLHFLPWMFPDAETHVLPMGSVSHVGLYLLWYLGCRPIYLVGQDLAFDPQSGHSHAAGHTRVSTPDMWRARGLEFRSVLANTGASVDTLLLFNQFRRQITTMIRLCQIECYNVIPQAYGIAIPGATRIDPDEAWEGRFGDRIDVGTVTAPIFARFAREQQAAAQASVRDTVVKTIDCLRDWIASSARISREVCQFDRHQPATAFGPFFRRLEELTAGQMRHHFYDTLMRPLTEVRHLPLAARAQEFCGRDAASLAEQLDIPLAWHAEIIVRARMVLRRLEQLVA